MGRTRTEIIHKLEIIYIRKREGFLQNGKQNKHFIHISRDTAVNKLERDIYKKTF